MKNKKILYLSAMAVLGLSACSFSLQPNGNLEDSNGPLIGNEVALSAKTPIHEYAIASSSSILMLADGENPDTGDTTADPGTETTSEDPTTPGDTDVDPGDDTDEGTEEELDLVDKYLAIYNQLTSEEALTIKTYESSLEGYKYVAVVTIAGIDGTKSEFYLYFNEAQVTDEEAGDVDTSEDGDVVDETTPDDPSIGSETEEPSIEENARIRMRNGDGDVTVDENLTFTTLDGLLVFGEQNYVVKGVEIVDEAAQATELHFYAHLDETRSIRVFAYNDPEANFFSYQIRENRKMVEKMTAVTETIGDYQYISLSRKTETEHSKYSFVTLNDETGKFIYIKFMNNEERGEIFIYITLDENGNQVIEYEFADGQAFHGDGHGNHHDGDCGGNGGHGHHGGDETFVPGQGADNGTAGGDCDGTGRNK